MITSTSNQQIRNLNVLIKKSKERKKQGVFVVEGIKMVQEAPKEWLRAVYVSESFASDPGHRELVGNFHKDSVLCEVVRDSVFKSVSDTQTPQGILAVVKMPEYRLSDMLCREKPMLLVLESIQDPGNLGTMIRTGEGAGVTGVIMNKTTVDLFNPKTIRSTMGSIYRVPFYLAEDFPLAIRKIKKNGVALYAAHLKGTCSYDEADYTGACGFMIGNEGNGLSDETSGMADARIRIPMEGKVESLNAAISASLFMYECSRQRRRSK